jgi:hypothetical protein
LATVGRARAAAAANSDSAVFILGSPFFQLPGAGHGQGQKRIQSL